MYYVFLRSTFVFIFQVRRSAQECLEKVFKSFQSCTVLRKASKLVLSSLESYMPLPAPPSGIGLAERPELEFMSKSENKEFLHMLNFVGSIYPSLYAKVRSQILTKVHMLFTSQFTTYTVPILKIIEAFLESPVDEDATSETENSIVSLSLYVSMVENPEDTIMSAANLLKIALGKLRSSGSILWIKYLPIVSGSIAGMLLDLCA